MSTILEKLVGAKALLDAAIDEELARENPPPAPTEPATECKHEHSEETTGAGTAKRRFTCLDCGESWEVD